MIKLVIRLLICTVFIFTIPNSVFSQKKTDAIIGKWYTVNKESLIQIYAVKGKYYGKIIWLKEPNDENGNLLKDTNNPKKDLQNRILKGVNILISFVYDEDFTWEDGKIYNPRDGNFYSAVLQMTDKNTLKVRGYYGFSWIGKTVIWTRKK